MIAVILVINEPTKKKPRYHSNKSSASRGTLHHDPLETDSLTIKEILLEELSKKCD